jgi:hypothetical protein
MGFESQLALKLTDESVDVAGSSEISRDAWPT